MWAIVCHLDVKGPEEKKSVQKSQIGKISETIVKLNSVVKLHLHAIELYSEYLCLYQTAYNIRSCMREARLSNEIVNVGTHGSESL